MKKVLFLFIALVFFIGGCGVNPLSVTQVPAAPQSVPEVPSGSMDKDVPVVLFIGNSLTYMSAIPEKFDQICETKKVSVSVLEVTRPGTSLSSNLKSFKYTAYLKSDITESDIVILQELGIPQNDTSEAINGFQELFGNGKQYYFLETEYDNFYGNDRKKLKDITFIRSGFAHNQLVDNDTFLYEDLHKPDDPHPNDLYGYIAAFTVFCKINKVKCSDYFSVDEMSKIIGKQSIKGKETEIKRDDVKKIQEAIDAALEDQTVK